MPVNYQPANQLPPPPPQNFPPGQPPILPIEPPPALPAPPPAPKPKPPAWCGSVELGLNGSTGNTETFTLRFGSHLKRKTESRVLSLDLNYRKVETDGEESANRMLGEGRQEYLFTESPWSLYIHGLIEYDEFRDFDLRLAGDAGVGYDLIRTGATRITLRSGPSFSQEIGGSNDDFVPELVFGGDFDCQISKRNKLTAKVDFYPSVKDPIDDYRCNSEGAWELLLSEEMNLSLKFSIMDRYDSTPGTRLANDLDYAALLLWKF